MPIKGIIFLAFIAVAAAICLRNEIYSWITDLSKDKDNNINKEENKGEENI